jgi:hypothetical protein
MPFKTTEHANLGYVDKEYKELLDKLCKHHKRNIKNELEAMIQSYAEDEGIIKHG